MDSIEKLREDFNSFQNNTQISQLNRDRELNTIITKIEEKLKELDRITGNSENKWLMHENWLSLVDKAIKDFRKEKTTEKVATKQSWFEKWTRMK